MALSTLAQNSINDACRQAKALCEQVKPVLDRLNVLYDAEGGLKATVKQADLDTVPAYSGLTKAQLDDGMYALTSTLKTAITNAYTQLAQLSARA